MISRGWIIFTLFSCLLLQALQAGQSSITQFFKCNSYWLATILRPLSHSVVLLWSWFHILTAIGWMMKWGVPHRCSELWLKTASRLGPFCLWFMRFVFFGSFGFFPQSKVMRGRLNRDSILSLRVNMSVCSCLGVFFVRPQNSIHVHPCKKILACSPPAC